MKDLFKIVTFIVLFGFILSACEKDSAELPPPLKAEVAQITNCTCLPFISKYSWRGEIVYFRSGRGASCNFMPLYYNKDGLKMEMEAGYTVAKFYEEATFIKTVWECK